ncbi:MAG: type II secretion system minor pseudopilin GspK [Legionellales bacterium]|nr:type II secretion system minor pseudopilin GspK [Legionellales bacterium]
MKKQQGSALLTSLLIVMIVASMAVMMLLKTRIAITRTRMMFNVENAEIISQAANDWAIKKLNHPINLQTTSEMIQQFPQHYHYSLNGFNVNVVLMDAEAKFNINNITNPQQLSSFIMLANQLWKGKLAGQEISKIASAILSYLSTDVPSQQNLINPAMSNSRWLVNISELRLIDKINAQRYLALVPYVIALPKITPININSASKMVFTSLGMTLEQAQAVVEYRQQHQGFHSIAEFMSLPYLHELNIPLNQLTLYSNYFMLKITLQIDNQTLTIYRLLQRSIQNGKVTVTVIWQSNGSAT